MVVLEIKFDVNIHNFPNSDKYLTLIEISYVSPYRVGRRFSLRFHLSVYQPVCPSQKLCPLYNLITVKDILMKLHTFVMHIKETCHAQEP